MSSVSPFRLTVSLGLVSLFAGALCAQTAVNFDEADHINSFVKNGAYDYEWSPAAGLKSSGGLQVSGSSVNSGTWIYAPQGGPALAYDFSRGPITLSLDFTVQHSSGINRAVAQLGILGDSHLRLGLLKDYSAKFEHARGPQTAYLTARLSPVFETNTWEFQTRHTKTGSRIDIAEVDKGSLGPPFVLENGHWHRLVVTITKLAPLDHFRLDGKLYSLGRDGAAAPVLLQSFSDITIVNPDVYDSDTLFAGFRSRGAESPNLDNFTVTSPIPN